MIVIAVLGITGLSLDAAAGSAVDPANETIVRFDPLSLRAAIRGATLPEGLSEFDCSRLRLTNSTTNESGVYLVYVDATNPRHRAALLLREDRLTGVIDHPEAMQERFTSRGVGRSGRARIKVTDYAPCAGAPESVEARPAEDAPPAAHLTEGCDSGAVVDVAAFYTARARTAAGSTDSIVDTIHWSISRSNEMHLNSAIPNSLRLVSVLETPDYVEDPADMGNDLTALSASNDGNMDEVHEIRNTVGADLTMLIRDNGGGYCGIAWILPTNSSSQSSSGFSVTAYGCVFGSVVTHEIGHNFGCCHAPGDGGGCGDHGLFQYSAGHRFNGSDGALYATIMSYAPGASIPHFSNPLVDFKGTPTGLADTRDNARTIRETSVALANFRCATEPIGTGGIVYAWGSDDRSQSSVPSNLRGVDHVAAGGLHTVASRSDGSVVCWGSNDFGQSTPPSTLPEIVDVDAGVRHSMALGADGLVYCWGANEYGQSTVPPEVGTVRSIVSGGFHCLAIRTDGAVRGWGQNNYGQCTIPASLVTAREIGAGASHSLAIRTDGTAVGWGRNTSGQASVPANLVACARIAGGDLHSVASTTEGSVRCWGQNNYGQCSVPVDLTGVEGVSAGASHTVVLLAGGSVRAWGRNQLGQTAVPTTLEGVTELDSGTNHVVTRVLVPDCNANGIPDFIDILSGQLDADGDGQIDSCQQTSGDIDGSGLIDFGDVALILLEFGPCSGCTTDLDGSGLVDFGDVALALLNFGPVA